jgi:hypothetical protein
VDNWLQTKTQTAFRPVVGADGFGLVSDTLYLWRNKFKATAKLSQYATTNQAEAFAEAFAARTLQPRSKWNAYVRRFDALLELITNRETQTTQWNRLRDFDGDERNDKGALLRQAREALFSVK